MIKDQQGTCIVEASDHQPCAIPNCPYNAGDTLIVTFKKGTAPIEKYYLEMINVLCLVFGQFMYYMGWHLVHMISQKY